MKRTETKKDSNWGAKQMEELSNHLIRHSQLQDSEVAPRIEKPDFCHQYLDEGYFNLF